MNALIGFLALLAERYAGVPAGLIEITGHPVQWMGRYIGWADDSFNSEDDTSDTRRRAGVMMLAVLLIAVLFVTGAIAAILRDLPLGWLIEAALAMPFLASRQLGDAVRRVADGLDLSLEEGQEAVSHIVGRDTAALDDADVSRAAIETLAENASDGVIAPLFWLLVLGLPGIALYKAINTADSMVGHLSDRHRDFGWASARLDDLANWIPARLTALLFAAAAYFTGDASPRGAWETAMEDAPKHKSPNAGWPEAALAGALGFSLGGPRAYGGTVLNLSKMGRGRRNLSAEDIRSALGLYEMLIRVTLVSVGVAALLGLVWG